MSVPLDVLSLVGLRHLRGGHTKLSGQKLEKESTSNQQQTPPPLCIEGMLHALHLN